MPVTILSQPVTVAEVLPGRMALTGKTVVSALPVGLVVRRIITLLADGTPAIISGITGGLTLDGADVFDPPDKSRAASYRVHVTTNSQTQQYCSD